MTQNRRLELAIETMQAQLAAHEILIKALFDTMPEAADLLPNVRLPDLFEGMRTQLFVDMVDKKVANFQAK